MNKSLYLAAKSKTNPVLQTLLVLIVQTAIITWSIELLAEQIFLRY